MSDRLSSGVIIPTYNRANHLELCVEGILRQTVIPDRIVIVDDSSDIDTEIIQEIIENLNHSASCWYFRVDYYESKRMRKPQALNVGIGAIDTDLVFLLDVDIIIEPNYVKKSIKLHERYENIVPVASAFHIDVRVKDSPSDIVDILHDESHVREMIDSGEMRPWGIGSWDSSTIDSPVIRKIDGMCAICSFRREHNLLYDPLIVGMGCGELDFYLNAVTKRVYPVLFEDLVVYHLPHHKGAWQEPEFPDGNRRYVKSKYLDVDFYKLIEDGRLYEI